MKITRLVAALTFAWLTLLASLPANAQSNNIMVVATCGAQSFPVSTATLTKLGILTEDQTGNLCTSGSGGGGGGAVTIADGADVTQGAIADGAATAGSTGTVSAKLRFITTILNSINTNVQSSLPAGTAIIGKFGIDQTTPGTTNAVALTAGTATVGTVGQLPYPVGATPITASATGTTGATTATLAGTSGKTTYICGYSIRANATANTNVTNTITGVVTATLSSIMWVPANTAGLGVDEQIFSPCIPASATNTGIAIVSGAPGTGGLVSAKGWGYQL